ncbi:MAG: response regulator transcription factor [Tannerellaceae bacterium]|jgi:DNA-binding response OmpR family regulator|nr:response regulator transcription factor [Tannerellaceae bacterium]
MKLLLVEDNSRISDFVMKGLDESGFSVVLADNGIEARTLISFREWDMILLDIILPGIDGIELLRYTRYKKINIPIIVISALNDPEDKIKALDCGADDYVTKPFLFRELLAHINALSRRARMDYGPSPGMLECNDLKMHVDRHKVERHGNDIKLTLQEFKLLRLLLENKDKVLSRTNLLDTVWGLNYNTNTNIVDVYISYLRNKIDKEGLPKLIKTIKGRGYMIQSYR